MMQNAAAAINFVIGVGIASIVIISQLMLFYFVKESSEKIDHQLSSVITSKRMQNRSIDSLEDEIHKLNTHISKLHKNFEDLDFTIRYQIQEANKPKKLGRPLGSPNRNKVIK